jgi:hypothetical protein
MVLRRRSGDLDVASLMATVSKWTKSSVPHGSNVQRQMDMSLHRHGEDDISLQPQQKENKNE